MATIARAPSNLIVATIDGVGVRLAGVELTKAPHFVDVPSGTPCIVIYLSAARGYETVRHDEIAYTQNRGNTEARDGKSSDDGPPKLSNLSRVGIAVTDDRGTQYEPSGFRMVGDAIGWDDMRIYSPSPASAATTLHLDFTLDGTSTGRSCDVDLTAR